MKAFALVDTAGEIRTTASVAEGVYVDGQPYGDLVARELPPGANISHALHQLFWGKGWEVKPARPSEDHIWQPGTGWVEDLGGAKSRMLQELKSAYRWGELGLSVNYSGAEFNANLETENSLLVAVLTRAFPQAWRTKDEAFTVLSHDQGVELLSAVREVKAVFQRAYWEIKDRVLAANSLAELPEADAQRFTERYGRVRN